MGGEVPIELAGGIEAPEPGLGTDAVRVAEAIERADQGDGVLVLMDLGSAVLSAEMALDMVSPERRARVLLTEAPLAEGAVAAAVTAKLGASLDEVAAQARGSLQAKIAHLGTGEEEEEVPVQAGFADGSATARLEVRNLLGLHARPAARIVQTAGSFDAEVTVTNVTTGRGPASGRSLNELATLGVRQGHEVLVAARGAQADEVLAALAALAERDFDERQEPARRAIFEDGLNAAQAWHTAADRVTAGYRSLDDDYLRARAEDLTGVARQVVAELVGGDRGGRAVVERGIVIAPDLTPAETATLDRELVEEIATAHGSATSHSAILARSLGIPAVVG